MDNIFKEFDYEEVCYECRSCGDDYSVDKDGELIKVCSNCPYNSSNWED